MRKLIYILITIVLVSCSVDPKPIEYGKDECVLCKMSIVDNQYAAELVTTKGKVYTFDSSECMINYMRDNTEMDFAHVLTNHYNNPEELIDATKAIYLISENLPSPMGANITAFKTPDEAKKMQQDKGGRILTFQELQDVELKDIMNHKYDM